VFRAWQSVAAFPPWCHSNRQTFHSGRLLCSTTFSVTSLVIQIVSSLFCNRTWAAKHNFSLQHWLVLKLGGPLLVYIRKVIPKFQLRGSIKAKVESGRLISQFERRELSFRMAEQADEHNFWLQDWLGLKLGIPLLVYMLKVVPTFQLRGSLEEKVDIGCPVSQFERAAKHNFWLQHLWPIYGNEGPSLQYTVTIWYLHILWLDGKQIC
jgi:hypothetical protein